MNDTLHCRSVVDIIEQTILVQCGVQEQSPGGGLGAKPPEAERFFSFLEGDCCIKTGGGGHHQWKILGGVPPPPKFSPRF